MNTAIVQFLVTTALVASPAPAQTQSAARAELRTEASVSRYVMPDLAKLTFQLSATGRTPYEAGRRLAARSDSLRRAFAAIGIPRDSQPNSVMYWWRGRIEQVSTTRYVTPPGRLANSIPLTDTTYRATDAIEVRVHDLRRIGAVLDSALAHRVLDIAPIELTATDTRLAQDSALADATRRVRRKAEIIAQAGGTRLGAIVSLGTIPASNGYGSSWTSSLSVRSENAPATEVIRSLLPVTMTVYATWELEPVP